MEIIVYLIIRGRWSGDYSKTIKSSCSYDLIIRIATISSKGTFSVRIRTGQPAGRLLTAYVTDRARNTSGATSFRVADKITPGEPSITKIMYRSTRATGRAEKYATVYAYYGKNYVGKAVVNSRGIFSMAIHKQKKGSRLTFFAKDKAGNRSRSRVVKAY